jgi:hypothetical protein
VIYFGYYCYGLLRCVNIRAVYVLGIGCKMLLSLMYVCVPFLYGRCVCYSLVQRGLCVQLSQAVKVLLCQCRVLVHFGSG